LHGATLSDSMEEARRIEREDGRVFVHAFDDSAVIAGQGTIGLELLEQVPDLTAVIVPNGGGGLISGIGAAVREQRTNVRIVGVEATAAGSGQAFRQARQPVAIETSEAMADAITVKRVGNLTFQLLERYVEAILVVEKEQIALAVHL